MDGAMPRAHQLKEGETVIGRAPSCDLVITAPLMSRHHAVVRVTDKRVFLKDAGSTYGTTFKGAKLTAEQEIKPGDSFTLGPITLTLDREIHENEVLSEKPPDFRRVGDDRQADGKPQSSARRGHGRSGRIGSDVRFGAIGAATASRADGDARAKAYRRPCPLPRRLPHRQRRRRQNS